MTFAEEIESVAGGADKIEAIVIGNFGWSYGEEEDDADAYGFGNNRKPIHKALKYIVLEWVVARPHLDYVYDGDFGAADCHQITVWGKDFVMGVHEYDGSTSLVKVPRNPIVYKPIFI